MNLLRNSAINLHPEPQPGGSEPSFYYDDVEKFKKKFTNAIQARHEAKNTVYKAQQFGTDSRNQSSMNRSYNQLPRTNAMGAAGDITHGSVTQR